MDMKIDIKTKMRFMDDVMHIAYFGFYDYEAEKSGEVEPYRHIDADYIEYTPTVFGYRVTLHDVYDLTNGRYATKDEMRKMKLMYIQFEDRYYYEEKNVEIINVEPYQFNESWMDVINFM